MSWFKKSKYSQNSNWWQDEEDYWAAKNGAGVKKTYAEDNDYGSYNRSYGYYYQKPLDMSISLETRAKQLIQGITGKKVKVVPASGWGLKDEYFFYRPSDLANATDDEVLGRIVHVIAQEKYALKRQMQGVNAPYQELHDTLEENRADYQVQQRYPGARYYARSLWERIKFTDNPVPLLENIKEQELSFEDYCDRNLGQKYSRYATDQQEQIRRNYADYKLQEQPSENPAWEFNFNIKAIQNDETDFDFSKDETLEEFKKAEPIIRQYLEMTDEGAMEAAFREIKKYYPKPDAKQRQQMQNQQNGGAGEGHMSEQAMKDAIARAQSAKEAQERQDSGQDAADRFFPGRKGSLDDVGDIELKRALAEYNKEKAQQQSVINTLHAFISSILKDNDAIRYSRPYKKGKVDMRRLYKYVAQDNMRIFKRKIVPTDKRYVMSILIDQSGSMSGSNQTNAFRGALILSEVFEMLKLPYEIIGFESKPYIFKSFGRPLQRALMPSLKQSLGGTNDFAALKLIQKHMAAEVGINDQQPKGVFIITDGGSGAPDEMKELIRSMEEKNNCKIYGIGIGGVTDDMLKPVYNQYFSIKNVSDLPQSLVALMRSQFRRG